MSPITQKCYICAGERFVAVAQHDDEERLVDVIYPCPRCHGTGEIEDGFGLRELLAVADSSRDNLAREATPCVCHFPTHGPDGHPHCPSH